MSIETLDEYRTKLAGITTPAQLDGECMNAVFTGQVAEIDSAVGTIVSVRHSLGGGLFGPMINTFVRLCANCAHKDGAGTCPHPSEIEERLVIWLDHVTRN